MEIRIKNDIKLNSPQLLPNSQWHLNDFRVSESGTLHCLSYNPVHSSSDLLWWMIMPTFIIAKASLNLASSFMRHSDDKLGVNKSGLITS